MALGDFKASAESLAQSTTTSGTYQVKLTLTTPNVDAGDYVIQTTLLWNVERSPATDQMQMRCRRTSGAPADIWETDNLEEHDRGDLPGDSQQSLAITEFVNLAAGVHDFDIQWRNFDSGGDDCSIEEVRVEFFKLGATFGIARDLPFQFTNVSGSYSDSFALATGVIPAGLYRFGHSGEFKSGQGSNNRDIGWHIEEITQALGFVIGEDVGIADELFQNTQEGNGSGDPENCNSWVRGCMELDNLAYTWQCRYRARGGGSLSVLVQNLRMFFWKID